MPVFNVIEAPFVRLRGCLQLGVWFSADFPLMAAVYFPDTGDDGVTYVGKFVHDEVIKSGADVDGNVIFYLKSVGDTSRNTPLFPLAIGRRHIRLARESYPSNYISIPASIISIHFLVQPVDRGSLVQALVKRQSAPACISGLDSPGLLM